MVSTARRLFDPLLFFLRTNPPPPRLLTAMPPPTLLKARAFLKTYLRPGDAVLYKNNLPEQYGG